MNLKHCDVIVAKHPNRPAQRFVCGDIKRDEIRSAVATQMDHARPFAFVYSDPPWSPGNEKFWRTHARKALPELPRDGDYGSFCRAWWSLAVLSDAEDIFVEQSIKPEWAAHFLNAGRSFHKEPMESWEVVYSGGPNRLYHYGLTPLDADPTGMKGEPMTARVFDALSEPGAVLEPCVGLGMTSRQAFRTDRSLVGSEINPERLARAIRWLEKQGCTIEVTHG
jgi:hypothetical protein